MGGRNAPQQTIVCWYLQGKHHPRVCFTWCRISSIHSMFETSQCLAGAFGGFRLRQTAQSSGEAGCASRSRNVAKAFLRQHMVRRLQNHPQKRTMNGIGIPGVTPLPLWTLKKGGGNWEEGGGGIGGGGNWEEWGRNWAGGSLRPYFTRY